MRFTQVAATATLAAAVLAAPVPSEDLGVSLGGGVAVSKREQADEDLGIGLGVGASVTKREEEAEDLGFGLGVGASVTKRESIASALANLAKSLGMTVSNLEKAL